MALRVSILPGMPESAIQNQHTQDARGGLFQNRNFMLLWAAYGISAMGDHLSEMAILKTQDALNPEVDIIPLSARMTFFMFVPFLLLSPIAGSLADRFSRRGIMVFADLARVALHGRGREAGEVGGGQLGRRLAEGVDGREPAGSHHEAHVVLVDAGQLAELVGGRGGQLLGFARGVVHAVSVVVPSRFRCRQWPMDRHGRARSAST